MLNPVNSSSPAPRRLRTKTLSDDAVDATNPAPSVVSEVRPERRDREKGRSEPESLPEDTGNEAENRPSAIDQAMKALLKDAVSLRSEAAAPTTPDHPGRVEDVPMTPEFRERRAVERHVTAATRYAQLERSDTRDSVLRPGAVFSKTF